MATTSDRAGQTLTEGQEAAYTFRVMNTGGRAAADRQVSVSLPAGVEPAEATQDGWEELPAGQGAVVRSTPLSVAAGRVTTRSLRVKVSPGALPGDVVNAAPIQDRDDGENPDACYTTPSTAGGAVDAKPPSIAAP